MPSARVPVKGRKLHPTADVALFQVDFSAASFGDEHPAPDAPSLDATSFDISPLSLPSAELTRLVPGVAVELAGYGLDEQGGAGALRYLVEQVVAISHLQVTVAGFGRSGACDGDSGAPLLMRENGSLVVSGVLSGGSLGCLYEDDYLRTDADQIRAWIQGIVGTTHAGLPSSHECGSITEQGRCLYGSALWCDSGTLIAEPCGDGRACGWSSAESGYRCSALEAPCSGIDEVGECRNGQAIRCVRGKTQATSCNGCATCQVNGETGIPYCAASSG